MKNSHREIVKRVAGVALVALLATGAAQADEARDTSASCREETKQVATWPRGPKAAQRPTRFEDRVLTVCDGKIVSSRRPTDQETMQARDSGE